jgi:hypothetical protein
LRKTKFEADEAVDVWLRHWSGQFGDDIAHDYRINAGRVSEVLNEITHESSRQRAAAVWKAQA